MSLRRLAIGGVVLALGAQSTIGAARSQFTESRAAVEEIKRGIDEAFECTVKYVTVSETASCDFAAERKNAEGHPDHRLYDAGFYFEAWHDLDVDLLSDQDLVKSRQAPTALIGQDQRYVGATYKFFRAARDRVGISNSQLLVITNMNPAGEAKATARLQFWSQRTR